jgi:hypothetical protein
VTPNEGFEVKLKDEERLEYMAYRNERDVVRNKKKVSEDKKDEKKPPFKDRVLEKAVEYLKGEIDKLGAGANVLQIKSA